MYRHRAFTITELLIVLTVVSILAAILFPVFAQAKKSANQAVCIGRFQKVALASQAYLGDYDDLFMPINHQPGVDPDPKTDRTWVQMLLPYSGTFKTFRCPADTTRFDQSEATFDQDLIPGDLFSRYYTASMHVNMGYNFQYLSPVVRTDTGWEAQPRSVDSLPDTASMVSFIDSAWQVENGSPVGGGNWLVTPPCRFQRVGGKVVDTIASTVVSHAPLNHAPKVTEDVIYAPVAGWQPTSDAGSQYGGAWPWHNGKLTVASIDGSVRPVTIEQLSSGCDVLPAWTGAIVDRHVYVWSPQ